MNRTYQPFIIKISESILEDLKDVIKPSDMVKEDICMFLTQRFIDGKLSEGDNGIFESDNEIHRFITLCKLRNDLEKLQELGLVGTIDDYDETFFLTEKGETYVNNHLKND